MFGLKQPLPTISTSRRDQEHRLDRHQEVTGGHQRAADDHRAAPADDAIGEKAAEDRRQVDEAGVEAVHVRRQRLRAERAERRFERAAKRGEADDVLADDAAREEVVDHVQHEQRAHAVVAHPLPRLGEEQDREALGVAEPGAFGWRLVRRGERRSAGAGAHPARQRGSAAARRAARPTTSSPAPSSVQVSGSGTAATASCSAAIRCSVSASALLMPRSFAACSSRRATRVEAGDDAELHQRVEVRAVLAGVQVVVPPQVHRVAGLLGDVDAVGVVEAAGLHQALVDRALERVADRDHAGEAGFDAALAANDACRSALIAASVA
jgi:hypothetical protein